MEIETAASYPPSAEDLFTEELRIVRRHIRRDRKRAKEFSVLFVMLLAFVTLSGGGIGSGAWAFACFAAIGCLLFAVYCEVRAAILAKRLRELKRAACG